MREQRYYRELLKLDEPWLYRILSNERAWDPSMQPRFAWMAGEPPEPTADEIKRDRQRKIVAHRRAANDLRRLAAAEADSVKRARFEKVAQMNDGLGDALERVLSEAVEAEKAEAKRRLAAAEDVEHALSEARRMLAEEDGRAKFRQLEPDIRTRLCTQWRACEQFKNFKDETALTMAIGDVLMTLTSVVPVATLSVLVVKIGVRKFCGCPA